MKNSINDLRPQSKPTATLSKKQLATLKGGGIIIVDVDIL